jgi:cell wall-associated NlpC family hydrolase
MPNSRTYTICLAAFAAAACLLPGTASAARNGGVGPDDPEFRTPGKARLVNGYAVAPPDTPSEVRAAIAAANRIVGRPYRYGGGHALVEDTGYDCSGTVSYALHGGGFLTTPLDSSGFMRWGAPGRGRWITVYTNPGHAFVVIAGLRLDTSAAGERRSSGRGPRWRRVLRSTRGFRARHPEGF